MKETKTRLHPSQLTGLAVPITMEKVVLAHKYNRINNEIFDDLWSLLNESKSLKKGELEDFILLNFISRREYLYDLNKIFKTLPKGRYTESVQKIQTLANWKCGHVTGELFDINKK